MRASTEEFLYFLWYGFDVTFRPSWRDLGGTDFDAWAWRRGLLRRIGQLQKQKLIERQPANNPAARIVRLTESGRVAMLGGRDPGERWQRPWDGKWRLVLFDLPAYDVKVRARLGRLLHRHHLGCLQFSVWVTPDPLDAVTRVVQRMPAEPGGFLVFEGRPLTGESDAAIVASAWDFPEINRRYENHLAVLRAAPKGRSTGPTDDVWSWARREREAWREAVEIDPLLPLALLPQGYLGCDAWRTRSEVLRRIFRAPPRK